MTPRNPGSRGHVHVLTPGDHFSARTGSAIPTVVHGLAQAASGHTPARVVVARGTYPDRYDSATVAEYSPLPAFRFQRYLDAGLSRIGIARVGARREWAATVSAQRDWLPSYVFAHNGPWLIPSVDRHRHEPVLWAHNDLLRSYSPAETYRALRQAYRIVCVSQFLADRMTRQLDARLRSRIRVVHNGVDTRQFQPAPPGELAENAEAAGDSAHPVHVVFVGRMIPDKGAHVLVKALAHLDREDIRATIVGSYGFTSDAELTPFEAEIRRHAARLRSSSRVLPFQPRPQVAAILAAADVVVVPSIWDEPAGLTVLEGMASGAALIASRVGGIPEYTGEAGVLVPPDDAAALAAALASFADDRERLGRARRAARTWATEHDWTASYAELETALA